MAENCRNIGSKCQGIAYQDLLRHHGVSVDVHLEGEDAGEELAAVADDDGVADAGQLALDGVLDEHGRNVLAARSDDQLLYPTRDRVVTFLVLKVYKHRYIHLGS